MPLARIISRSQACSRELALELLARGYTVEIVTPDKLPDSMADLELRVDEGPGDHLFAKVATREGERSASLDFVHHLKTPLGDFVRRPIQSSEGTTKSKGSVHNEPIATAIIPVVEPVKVTPKLTVTPLAPSSSRTSVQALVKPQSTAPAAERPPDNSPPLPVKPPNRPVIASPVVLPASTEFPKLPSGRHNSGRTWRAALALACIFLLALSLWFGVRHRGAVTASASADAAVNKIKVSDRPVQSVNPPEKAETPKFSTHVNPKPSKQSDDYVAPNTIVYLNRRAAEEAVAKAKSPKRSTRSRAASNKVGDGIVAANSVTYLSNKPQTPKPDSGVGVAPAPK